MLRVTISSLFFIFICCPSLFYAMEQSLRKTYRRSEMAPYRVIGSYYSAYPDYAYEKRVYPQSKWVTTRATNGFNVLFGYISGRNAVGAKIDMTVPVLNTVQKSQNGRYSYETAFYLPEKYQRYSPSPLNAMAETKFLSEMTVYVRTYGGWGNQRTTQLELEKLQRLLKFDGRKYRKDTIYTASYDSPWYFGTRRNEVWLIADEK